MNVSSISAGALAGTTSTVNRPADTTTAGPVGAAESKASAYEPREFGLSVLQAEIRQVLSTRLKFSFGSNGYDSAKVSVAGVASESLSAASWLLREAPIEAARELRELRDDIDAAGDSARKIVGENDDTDLDGALTRIDKGLDKLGEEAGRNSVSTASVLTAESRIKQRSTVRIRTQDGDMVTLQFRQRESFSATSAADAYGSVDKLEMNSRSRMDLKIRGNLDEGEMQAIKAVFERAQEIAGSFFGGDLGEAFSKASELEFDRSELAKVKMKFREQEVSSIRFTQTQAYLAAEPTAPQAAAEVPVSAVPSSPEVASETVPGKASVAPASEAEPVAAVVQEDVAAEGSAGVEEASTEPVGAIERFVVDIRSFLRSTMEGFEKSDGQRYFYSESFKLSILKSVIETSTPQESDEAGERAVAVVNAIRQDD